MDIGFGTAAALWLLSGVLFWGGFVALGLGFRAADEDERAAAASERSPGRRRTPDHVVARTRR